MGVPVEQNVSRVQGREALLVEVVAVGGKDHPPSAPQQAVVRQNGELEHHLVHFSVAVAPHTENAVLQGI